MLGCYREVLTIETKHMTFIKYLYVPVCRIKNCV